MTDFREGIEIEVEAVEDKMVIVKPEKFKDLVLTIVDEHFICLGKKSEDIRLAGLLSTQQAFETPDPLVKQELELYGIKDTIDIPGENNLSIVLNPLVHFGFITAPTKLSNMAAYIGKITKIPKIIDERILEHIIPLTEEEAKNIYNHEYKPQILKELLDEKKQTVEKNEEIICDVIGCIGNIGHIQCMCNWCKYYMSYVSDEETLLEKRDNSTELSDDTMFCGMCLICKISDCNKITKMFDRDVVELQNNENNGWGILYVMTDINIPDVSIRYFPKIYDIKLCSEEKLDMRDNLPTIMFEKFTAVISKNSSNSLLHIENKNSRFITWNNILKITTPNLRY